MKRTKIYKRGRKWPISKIFSISISFYEIWVNVIWFYECTWIDNSDWLPLLYLGIEHMPLKLSLDFGSINWAHPSWWDYITANFVFCEPPRNDENKEKEAVNGPLKKKEKNHHCSQVKGVIILCQFNPNYELLSAIWESLSLTYSFTSHLMT